MGKAALAYSKDVQELRQAERRAARELPASWLPLIAVQAQSAKPQWGGVMGHPLAGSEVWNWWLDRYGGAAAADLSDSEIKARARSYAQDARMLEIGLLADKGPWGEFARLIEFCAARDVDPPHVRFLLVGMGARVRCQYWWRKALRRMIARKCERGALALGIVSKPHGQPYASNSAVFRRIDQNKRNARAADAICFENDAGLVRSLSELAATSTSNKSIRRGELMTRIRGCEEIASEYGHVGVFLTLTCPSRFHSTRRDGARNPKHDGSTPRDAQQWLCKQWQLARAKMSRRKCEGYGFRVAEPHHDGCTHWHALLWFDDEAKLAEAVEIIRQYWLRDEGDEPGAQKYRLNAKRMERGGAAGYIAKYIAKNIDDHGIETHHDDYADSEIEANLFGEQVIKPSMRVEAWATTWGIRQFQPLGQAPVTVWRELRRISEDKARAAGVGGIIHKAWLAAQRNGNVLASWSAYVKAQGGMLRGRRCRVVLRRGRVETEGLYGKQVRAIPVGVALNVRGSRCVWSERRLWRPLDPAIAQERLEERGFSALREAPWTRVNNCTAEYHPDGSKRSIEPPYLGCPIAHCNSTDTSDDHVGYLSGNFGHSCVSDPVLGRLSPDSWG
jgi:hypothetical protein